MISKAFVSAQAKEHLCYSITCGFSIEKFIFGKGLYGNRISLMRNKDGRLCFGEEPHFKVSVFHAVEGLKPLEFDQTIALARNKLENLFRDKESMRDLLKAGSGDFITGSDLEQTLKIWHEKVSRKLITNSTNDFKMLDDFVLNAIILILPIGQQERIAQFRKKQLLRLLDEQVLEADYVNERLQRLPAERDKLIVIKQKLLQQNKTA